eukprot:scaffold15609_cov19-Tisochrysis_lutea.AAC.2
MKLLRSSCAHCKPSLIAFRVARGCRSSKESAALEQPPKPSQSSQRAALKNHKRLPVCVPLALACPGWPQAFLVGMKLVVVGVTQQLKPMQPLALSDSLLA